MNIFFLPVLFVFKEIFVHQKIRRHCLFSSASRWSLSPTFNHCPHRGGCQGLLLSLDRRRSHVMGGFWVSCSALRFCLSLGHCQPCVWSAETLGGRVTRPSVPFSHSTSPFASVLLWEFGPGVVGTAQGPGEKGKVGSR